MRSVVFLDTNVLIYAAAGISEDRRKYEIARDIIAGEAICLSAQVLAEFYHNVTRKLAVPLPRSYVSGWLDRLEEYPIAPVDALLVRVGAFLSERFRISYWDAAIIAAAERLGAQTLYTEDLNHGQTYGSVRVMNPFRED